MVSSEEKDIKDVERQDDNRRGSRVGGPLRGSTVLNDDNSSTVSVGKQIELEAGNSIKYRSCSWQKVRSPARILPSSSEQRGDRTERSLDCRSSVQRVYMPRYYVLPLLVLGARSGSWSYSYRGRRGYRSIHELDNLAILSSAP